MYVISTFSKINTKKLAKKILWHEPRIIKKYPPLGLNGVKTDGATQLGFNSLTSRVGHYNILNWWGTRLLRKSIRNGYEKYNGTTGKPLYVQCWANVMRKGEQIKPHKHSQRVSAMNYLCGHLCVQVDGYTATYYDGNPILNENGNITFFPGYAEHWTDVYMGDSERITVAFDILSEEFYNIDIEDQFKYHWVKI
tara:strand:- start:68 stop:652 length:585 start_codon:yes stop_codon:yes gene_type:complete